MIQTLINLCIISKFINIIQNSKLPGVTEQGHTRCLPRDGTVPAVSVSANLL
jgi:hypothetical protein